MTAGPITSAPAGPGDENSTPVRLLFGFLYVVGAFVASIIASGVFVAIASGAGGYRSHHLSDTSSSLGIMVAASGELGFVLYGLFTMRFWGGTRAVGFTRSGVWGGLRATLPILFIAVLLPLAGAFGKHSRWTHPGFLATCIVFVVCVGIGEELIFRGVLVEILGGARHPWTAVIGSAVLFGAGHFTLSGSFADVLRNALSVILIFGIPFAIIRVRGGALWGLVLVHALNDLDAVMSNGKAEPGHSSISADIVGVSVAAIIAAGYLIWFVRTRDRPQTLAGHGTLPSSPLL